MVGCWELPFALDFNMVSLSKVIFLECHTVSRPPNSADWDQQIDLQLSPWLWYSAYTKNNSDIPIRKHMPASKEKKKLFPWVTHRHPQNIRLLSYNSCDISFCSFTDHWLWPLESPGSRRGTAAMSGCAQAFPSGGWTPRCPPTVAALMPPPWLGRDKHHVDFTNRWPAAHNMFLPTLKDCMNGPLRESVPHWGDVRGTTHLSDRAGLALVHGVTPTCHICLLRALGGMQTVDGCQWKLWRYMCSLWKNY